MLQAQARAGLQSQQDLEGLEEGCPPILQQEFAKNLPDRPEKTYGADHSTPPPGAPSTGSAGRNWSMKVAVRPPGLKLKIPAWVFCTSSCPDFEFRGTQGVVAENERLTARVAQLEKTVILSENQVQFTPTGLRARGQPPPPPPPPPPKEALRRIADSCPRRLPR